MEDFTSFALGPEDYVFLPGLPYNQLSDPGFLGRCAPFFAWLRNQYDNGAAICSVCTGAFLVAEAGLLRGRNTTTHWKYFGEFRRRFPGTELQSGRLFVTDGNLHASAGVSSGIDLALRLIEARLGSEFAARIAKEVVVYLRRGEDDPQLSVFLRYRNHLDDRVHTVQDLMAQRLSEAPSLAELAGAIHTSPRNLTRLFRKATGLTVGAYQDQLRAERARRLLAEGHTVAAAARAVGLRSANRLRAILGRV